MGVTNCTIAANHAVFGGISSKITMANTILR
jgi:hypothetical protein